jgi:predicted phage terminase large subunit-like protein
MIRIHSRPNRLRRDDVSAHLSSCLWLLHESIESSITAAGSRQGDRRTAGLLEWARAFLPEHFRLPPSKMHRWLAKQLDEMQNNRGRKLNVVGPRGGAKSTIGSLAFVLRAAVEAKEPYVWIVSDAKHQAVSHLENIKTELRENPRLSAVYPEATAAAPVWRENSVRLANGVTIEAFGTGQRIRGRRRRADRPTLIICDDIQDDRHIESSLARDHSRRWFHGMLMKAGTKRTNVLNLATALHREALAMELHATPGWNSRVFQAIERWPDRMDLWDEWERIYADVEREDSRTAAREFYDLNRSAMDSGAALLWPDEEDLYTLMCMRVEGGRTAFEREKQNVPINPEMCEWPEAYFGDWIWFDRWPDAVQLKVIALDPSKGHESGRGDYSAFAMLAIDGQGVLYVDADLSRRPTPQIVADGVELCQRFRPDVFGIETNQFQELLGGEFTAELARRKLIGIVPWSIENRTNKQTRIRRLGPYLSSHRIRFRSGSPGTRLLVEQLKEFPLADHDDGPDAVEMAIRLAAEWFDRRGRGDGLGNRLPLSV